MQEDFNCANFLQPIPQDYATSNDILDFIKEVLVYGEIIQRNTFIKIKTSNIYHYL
jgi:hypothetical protein